MTPLTEDCVHQLIFLSVMYLADCLYLYLDRYIKQNYVSDIIMFLIVFRITLIEECSMLANFKILGLASIFSVKGHNLFIYSFALFL